MIIVTRPGMRATHFFSMSFIIGLLLCVLLGGGCAPAVKSQGQLGYSDARRVVIVGENVDSAIAVYYQRKYDALVWFTPFEGKIANAANNLLEAGLGPSRAMQALMTELKSINYTVGRWEIIVPKIAEKYFLHALKNMETSSLAKARGEVVLIDSSGFPQMEQEVHRVTDGNFFVTYEFHKDLAQ